MYEASPSLLVVYMPISVPYFGMSLSSQNHPSTTGMTKETAFESPTLRYLKHPPHPLQTPISSCECTSILKKNRPFRHPDFPDRHLVGFLIGRTVKRKGTPRGPNHPMSVASDVWKLPPALAPHSSHGVYVCQKIFAYLEPWYPMYAHIFIVISYIYNLCIACMHVCVQCRDRP